MEKGWNNSRLTIKNNMVLERQIKKKFLSGTICSDLHDLPLKEPFHVFWEAVMIHGIPMAVDGRTLNRMIRNEQPEHTENYMSDSFSHKVKIYTWKNTLMSWLNGYLITYKAEKFNPGEGNWDQDAMGSFKICYILTLIVYISCNHLRQVQSDSKTGPTHFTLMLNTIGESHVKV